uniref:F-box protein interaction domain containing protein n=1 Tax=Solanum tuberosum TaxID=4113 RepID=M1DI77_SOLTU
MRNGNRAEEHNGLSVRVKMPDDVVMKIISGGFEVVVQCKLLSKKIEVLDTVDYPMYFFHSTLGFVHKTPSNYVTTAQQAYIDEKLDDIRRFIIEDTSEEEVGEGGGGEEEETL